ncbi:MAG: DUF72 domain-containing protein [Candidatus Zipacnadales bacterium]
MSGRTSGNRPTIGRIRIGTSGWAYPHWRGTFYPPQLKSGEFLVAYSQQFETVELNYSFYRKPSGSALSKWFATTPEEFLFSAKAYKHLTHRLQLADATEVLEDLLARLRLLGNKLGPVLFQFPQSFLLNLERLESFLVLLPSSMRFTFEFRHPSWFTERVYELLHQYSCALTIADSPTFPQAFEVTGDFVYCRLHGNRVLYSSSYTEKELEEWAERAQTWSTSGRDVFVYFDNDFHAHAPHNALQLRQLLGQLPPHQ